jgi:hypothetical protein
MELEVRGEQTNDYFAIKCVNCRGYAHCEYLGYDPSVPHFRATCRRCKRSAELKMSPSLWLGLPTTR